MENGALARKDGLYACVTAGNFLNRCQYKISRKYTGACIVLMGDKIVFFFLTYEAMLGGCWVRAPSFDILFTFQPFHIQMRWTPTFSGCSFVPFISNEVRTWRRGVEGNAHSKYLSDTKGHIPDWLSNLIVFYCFSILHWDWKTSYGDICECRMPLEAEKMMWLLCMITCVSVMRLPCELYWWNNIALFSSFTINIG